MKAKLHAFVGIMCLINVVYKLATCIPCDEKFFGMEVSGYIYLTIWIALAAFIFYGAHRESKKVGEFK